QPEVIIKEIGGVNMEPFERLVVEIPADYQGVVIEEVGKRGGELKNVVNGEHEVELEYIIPTRGLIGLKSLLMTRTKGLIIMHSIFEEYKPMLGSLLQRRLLGSIISTDTGTVRAYAMQNAQDRGVMFVGPGDEVYEGQVVGQNAREFDMELNPCKEKELSNMRSRGAVKLVPLTPPHRMSLEAGLEYIGPDELVEATPKSIRLRKQELAALERRKIRRTESED
ncbi:MAG: translational GTPase TypA, partial [Candidatus Harrisonbacteria bacterium]|nr:translational GTPase TypA [Candidatus Harrisonbacteria bacterium]